MPHDSAFVRSIDPDGSRWDELEHLVADLVDVTLAAHGSKHRLDRPGQKAAQIARETARAKRWEERTAVRRRAKAKQRGEASA